MSEEIRYEHEFHVRWTDVDPNWHMRSTSYSEYASNTRVALLSESGFPPLRFAELNFGPVLFREDVHYRRELKFGEPVRVDVMRHGLSADASHWEVRHRIYNRAGKIAAELFIEGSWMDIATRKLILPPAELAEVMRRMAPTEEFRELPTVVKNPV